MGNAMAVVAGNVSTMAKFDILRMYLSLVAEYNVVAGYVQAL